MNVKTTRALIIGIVFIDQISKIYIKTNFMLGESINLTQWFKIYFIENDGMAWGTKLSDIFPFISDYVAKTILTIFRILAVTAIGFWLHLSLQRKQSKQFILALSFILAGALGNIIDSTFYGVLFSDSYQQIAQFLPKEGGYSSLLHGNVVDMLYFPIWKGYLPEWFPFYGGNYAIFFEPVFNIADVAISIGFLVLLFSKKMYSRTR